MLSLVRCYMYSPYTGLIEQCHWRPAVMAAASHRHRGLGALQELRRISCACFAILWVCLLILTPPLRLVLDQVPWIILLRFILLLKRPTIVGSESYKGVIAAAQLSRSASTTPLCYCHCALPLRFRHTYPS